MENITQLHPDVNRLCDFIDPESVSISDAESRSLWETATPVPQVHEFTDSTNSTSSPSSTNSDDGSFPVEKLPGPLGDIVQASVKSFRVSPELAGIIGLATVSAAIGKGLRCQTNRFLTPANLLCIVGANSGSGKGLCYRALTAPLVRWEAEALHAWNQGEGPRIRTKRLRLEERRKRLAKELGSQDEPDYKTEYQLQAVERELAALDEVRIPGIFGEDITPQSLVVKAKQRNGSLALFSAEGGAILRTLEGQWNSLGKVDDAVWLKGYSLEPYQRDRVGMPPVQISELCLNSCVCTQPDEVANLFRNERFLSGGALARTLVINDQTPPQLDDGTDPALPADVIEKWDHLLVELVEAFRFREEFAVVQASETADEVFRSFRNDWILDWGKRRDLSGFDARHAENAIRVAICLHASQWGKDAPEHELDGKTAVRAVALIKWFSACQDAELSGVIESGKAKRWRRIEEAIENCSKDIPGIGRGAYVSDLRRNHFRGDDPETFAEEFPDRLKLIRHRTGSAGPTPAILIFTNPENSGN